MTISEGLMFFAKLDQTDPHYDLQLIAIILLSKSLVHEGYQYDWDHIEYQREHTQDGEVGHDHMD